MSILYLVLLLFACIVSVSNSSPYKLQYVKKKHPLYSWVDVAVSISNHSEHNRMWSDQSKRLFIAGTPIARVSQFDLIVSLTSVSFRIDDAWIAIYSILNGLLLPTKIYLFISLESHLHDKGVDKIPDILLCLAAKGLLNIVYTNNLGPHRKLLPLLAQHFSDSTTLIATVDDDTSYGEYNSTLLYQLFNAFIASNGTSVVAARNRYIGLCKDHRSYYAPYHAWGLNTKPSNVSEMLMIPTGTKGVLYTPQFFHPIVFSERLRNLTDIGDDIAFRLSCMANNVKVVRACHEYTENGMFLQSCEGGDMNALRDNSKQVYALISASNLYLNRSVHYLERNNCSITGKAVSDVTNRRLVELWRINIEGGNNDKQLRAALKYMSEQGVIPRFEDLLEKHFAERSPECYEERHLNRRKCSIFNCEVNPHNMTGQVRILGKIY